MGYEFKRPDATAMERVLARHPADPEGAVLRLAWQAGLSREEIAGLTWPQVDLTDSVLYLSDRTVPLEGDTLNCLRRRHERYAAVSDHVVISDRYKRPMPPESVSRLARNALDAEDLRVSLKDLRQDFVIRQLETHDWPYAARVSGMAVSTLRGAFSQYFRPKEEKRPGAAGQYTGAGIPPLADFAAGGRLPCGDGPVDELETEYATRRDLGAYMAAGGLRPRRHHPSGPRDPHGQPPQPPASGRLGPPP